MTVPISSLIAPQTPAQWLTVLLTDASTAGLPTTAWQSGDPLRTVLSIMGLELSKEDSVVAQQVQGGFLDFAATGTYMVTDINGNALTLPVSPDPSIPAQGNPNGNPTWLDVLASSVYNVTRVAATSASGPLLLVNTTGSSLGTFLAGTFHARNPTTQATFSNTASFTLSPSTALGGGIASVTYGSPVVINTNAAHGLSTGQSVFISGVPWLTGGGLVNGGFATVTFISATSFSLNGVSGAGVYSGGGKVYSPLSVAFQADLVGTAGSSGVGQITSAVTAIPGGFLGNMASFAGSPWQSNASLAAMCRAKLATLSSSGPSGAYVFFALSASLIVSGQPVVSGGPVLPNPLPANITLDGGSITRAVTSLQLGTGIVTVTVANAAGPVPGCVNNPITNVTAASPVVVTSPGHGMQNLDYCEVNGVQGINGANGQFQITFIDANTFSLNGSTGTGVYTANTGQVSGGDLYAVGAVLATYATPNGNTETTQSATGVTATITALVYVPNAFVSQYIAAMTAALAAYFSSFPIGGLNVDSQQNILPIGAIEGLLFAAGTQGGSIYTLSVTAVAINGAQTDLALGATGVAQLGVLTGIQVVGV